MNFLDWNHQHRMTTQMNKITEVIEATAGQRGQVVEATHVRKAVSEMRYRVSLIEDACLRPLRMESFALKPMAKGLSR